MKGKIQVILPIGIVLLLSACGGIYSSSTLKQDPVAASSHSSIVQSHIRFLESINSGLDGFKGIGKATLRTNSIRQTMTTAWMASGADKLRVEVLAPTGSPAFTFSSDGKWIYLLSHQPSRFYKKRADGNSLQDLFQIPVRPGDMTFLLGGRVPLRKHRFQSVEPQQKAKIPVDSVIGNTPSADTILVLKDFFGNVVQRIQVNLPDKRVVQVEFFHSDGTLAYRVLFRHFRRAGNYRVPSEIRFADDGTAEVTLRTRKYWTDVPVAPSRFILSAPSKTQS